MNTLYFRASEDPRNGTSEGERKSGFYMLLEGYYNQISNDMASL